MFEQDGLILLNSGDPGIRALEARFFRQLLNRNDELTDSVKRQQEFMQQLGYTPIIEGAAQHANLFYEHDGERFLIEKENGAFFIKELHLQWSEAELCDLICQKPEAFSNNVVTRPLMQEYLLPTLAFIAGPGEINYWGELKGAFQVMGYKMPPVIPRLQVTFLERHIEKSWASGESNSVNRLKREPAPKKSSILKIRFRAVLPIRSNRRKKKSKTSIPLCALKPSKSMGASAPF